MQIGIIGLGKMGSRIAKKLLQEGHEVVVWNRSEDPINKLKSETSSKSEIQNKKRFTLAAAKEIKDLVRQLSKPRVVWSMLPAGEATENILKEVSKYVQPDDIVIDAANSNYKDTERRYKKLRIRNIRFLGIGVSGGIVAFRDGYPAMVGGDRSAYEYIKPILDSLAKPHGGHEYFGKGGAGHFVKMVHNGIEYGIMQSLAEGFDVLKNSKYGFDLIAVGKVWQRGTLVSGFMLDRSVEALEKYPNLEEISGSIVTSGEGDWTVEAAKELGIPVEIIEGSLEYRKRSQKDPKIQNSFTAKMVAAQRNMFGGHEVKKYSNKQINKSQINKQIKNNQIVK